MVKHLKYLKYVIQHKWYVFLECCKMGIPILGLLHDWSKFLPSEWFPYVAHFYGKGTGIKTGRDSTGYYKAEDTGDLAFDFAWLLHQKRNKHHWQYWVLPEDDGGTVLFELPMKYAKEMLCDWKGAGKAQGTPNTKKWYEKNKEKMKLHPTTRELIEDFLYERRKLLEINDKSF